MANDNETVEQVCESVEYLGGTDGGGLEIFGEHINPISLADRILSAHNRELAAKDAMIAEQSAVNEAQAAQLRDALNECEELKCAIADSKRISDAVVKSLRDKNLEMAGEIAAKDAEISSLRLLVKELADELDSYPCHNCKHGSERCEWCGTVKELDALVAKAREVVK